MQLLTATGISARNVVLALALSACNQGRSVISPSPELPHAIQKRPSEVKSWMPQIATGIYHYAIRDSSTISINSDTATQIVPITSTTIYSLSIDTMGDSAVLVGKVDSAMTNSPLARKNSSATTAQIKEVHGIFSARGQLRLAMKDSLLICSSSSNPIDSRIYELILPVRQEGLKIGDSWTDTISITNCHGKTPVDQRVIRNFTVNQFTTWNDRPAVEIARNSSFTFTGTVTDPNSHLSTHGTGTGTATMYFDRKTASLLESNSQTESTVVVITSRGEFPFIQHTISQIVSK